MAPLTAVTEPTRALVLSRYRLHRPLGAGGFGTVWLARDERLEREVAIKMLPRERVIWGRFEREARAAARLSHPAIVTLYEAAVDDSAAYLVSELVRGPTFGALLEAGRLSDRDILTIGSAICDALDHAHSHRVVHRDVKPSNVLVPEHPCSPTQVAKLTDFGVARVIGGNTLTRTGEVVGTAAYMAPEQAEGREADAAGDLYSLALVLYEALTGVNPFAAETAAGRARRLGAHLPPLRRHRRDLPRELGRSLDLALRQRPRERGTVAELRRGLLDALDQVEDIPGVVTAAWTRLPSARREERALDQEWVPDEKRGADEDWASDRDEVRLQRAEPNAERAEVHWPDRLLAALGAAVAAAWLTATAFASPPVAPAGAALIGGLAAAALPRIGWLGLSLTAAAGLAAAGRAGAGLVVLIAALVPMLLLFRKPTRWPLPVAAPLLGAVLLGGAWPALAGRDSSAWRRAGLGALGWIWIATVGLISGRGAYAQLPAGVAPRATWTGSVDQAVAHALWPVLHSGLLVPTLAWAVAAAVLPWVNRGPLALRFVSVTIWSAALASTTATMLQLSHSGVSLKPGAAILGGLAGGIVALAPAWISRRRRASVSSDTAAGLA
jgi:hypothetical protein